MVNEPPVYGEDLSGVTVMPDDERFVSRQELFQFVVESL